MLPNDVVALLNAKDGLLLQSWAHHRGVVSTASFSADGQSCVTGGWDGRVVLQSLQATSRGLLGWQAGWLIRRVRYSKDGRYVAVAAWAPPKSFGQDKSSLAAVLLEVDYAPSRLNLQ